MSEPLRFVVDEHISNDIVNGLRERGVDVATLHDVGRLSRPDPEQLAWAREAGRVVVTHDTDYLKLDREGVMHAGIAWCRFGKYSIGEMIEAVQAVAAMPPEGVTGFVVYL